MTTPEDTELLTAVALAIFGGNVLPNNWETDSRIPRVMNLITVHTKEAVAEVIGEDETDDMTDENTKPVHDDWLWRNELRAEQRAKAHLTNPTERSE